MAPARALTQWRGEPVERLFHNRLTRSSMIGQSGRSSPLPCGGRQRRSTSAFVTTLTGENAIAARPYVSLQSGRPPPSLLKKSCPRGRRGPMPVLRPLAKRWHQDRSEGLVADDPCDSTRLLAPFPAATANANAAIASLAVMEPNALESVQDPRHSSETRRGR